MDYEHVLTRALGLPPGQRGALAARLIESLDPPGDDDLAEVEAAWAAEIERRQREIERGEVKLLDGPATLEELKRELA